MTNVSKKGFNLITVSRTGYDHKPTKEQTSGLQLYRNSKVMEVTPSSFAQLVREGHGFHLGVFDKNVLIEDKVTKEKRKSKAFIDKGVKFQNVFGIDIDHHNFTLEDLLERCPIKPNVIYKTHSYTEENKRWRIIFFCAETVKDEEVIRIINQTLTSIFLENLPEEVLAFSDTSAVNPARLFYAGKEVVYVDEESRFFLKQLLGNQALIDRTKATWELTSLYVSQRRSRQAKIRNNRTYLTDEEWAKWEALKKEKTVEAFNLFIELADKIDSLKIYTRQGKKRKQNAPTPYCEPSARPIHKELIEAILEQLPTYAPEGVEYMDYSDAIAFIDRLPLDVLIEETVGVPFLSYLREETNPSAVLFHGEDGKILHYDFATKETYGVTMFLSMLFAQEWGTIFYSNVETILSTMGVMMDSQYCKDAKAQIDKGVQLVYQIADGKKPHVSKAMFKNGVGHLYVGFCNVLKQHVPNECLLASRQGVVVSRSLKEIHEELLTGFFADVDKMKIKSKKRFVEKVNMLCALGLITKIPLAEVTEGAQEEVNEHRKKLVLFEEVDAADYNHPNFYEINPVTLKLLAEGVEVFTALKQKGLTTTTIQQKNLKAVKKEKSDEVFIQNHRRYSAREEKFIKVCVAQSKKLLKKQAFFTEKELLDGMLRKDEWFNGTKKETEDEVKLDKLDTATGERIVKANKKLGDKRKKSALKYTRPGFLAESGCVVFRIHELPEELIAELQIPKSINKNSSIMFKAEKLNGHKITIK